ALLREDLTEVRLRIKLQGWFGDLVPAETLIAWARKHGRRGFRIATALLNSKQPHLSDTARRLIHEADNPDEVLSILLGNMESGGFVGPISDHMERHLALLKSWTKDEEPRIRSWAERAVAHASKNIERHRLLEEEQEF